ncbi:NAD(P)H-quinone oxidoreductase [Endozoicomonas sp. SM1973]|uniref:NAD(P)H-quinone oxidoreductase n=1 Tax=Spartinivicinus marinus TaxID=2994442 RepID=A0A853ICA8_9GAMM|nr:NAD(P)H-quinone oxidoreductase [Spartinivicinus marinus]MCX4026463.1 NAD(P)H-quinone oxidoreductase [Spartinivicinus marinus]NYZ66835.1 NAD(P)H-quinone oxidoreductase [Spartinivicinus marinus]
MKAVEITGPGGPDVLSITERKMPEPKTGEVLIKVAAAGINAPDLLQRKGKYPPPPGASDIPGLEVAGEVVKVGEHVTQLKVGDKVCALLSGGGYAEFAVAAADLCLPIPDSFSMVEAAALPETFFTVWHNVFERGQLTAGETLLIHGGTSGIGTTAIQLAVAKGATVYATAGTKEKCDLCLKLGASAAINYREEDFVEKIKAYTEGKGVSLILDMVGGDYFPRNLSCLAVEGRLVQIGMQHGATSEISLWQIMSKRLTITGSTLRARSVEDKAKIAAELKGKIWPLLNSGAVKPVIHSTFPLAEAKQAHQLMESGKHAGKIILTT